MTYGIARFVVCSALGLALATLAGPGRALAQDAPAEGTPPAEGTARPAAATPATPAPSSGGGYLTPTDVTLRQGAISIDGDVVVNLSSDAVGEPVQIVPNLYYGVNDALTVGFAQNPGAEIFQTTGSGLCITGSSKRLRALLQQLQPGRPVLVPAFQHDGPRGPRWARLRVARPVPAEPSPRREGQDDGRPRCDRARPVPQHRAQRSLDSTKRSCSFLPASASWRRRSSTSARPIGLIGPVDGFGDAYTLPLGLGATFAVSNMIDVRAQFTLTDLTGHSTGSGATGSTGGAADGRALSVGAAYRM